MIDQINYRIPESLRAFWRIVSLTAAKTSRTLLVSVACVKLEERFRLDILYSNMMKRTGGIHLILHGLPA
jgi:hypothetical protein